MLVFRSFPDAFVFHGSMNSAFTQIGNAVPPLLAYQIALTLKRTTENFTPIRWRHRMMRSLLQSDQYLGGRPHT